MTDTDKILTAEEIKDTTILQMVSLKNFFSELGYEPLYFVKGIVCFESDCPTNKGRSTISFSNAVNIYNGRYLDWHGVGGNKTFKPPFDFDPYRLKRAIAARIVEVVNIQKNKKTGMIKPTSQIVKFVDPVFYKMWIGSKKFPF
jgi:hypothetical protein